MIRQFVELNPVEPAPIGFRQPRGVLFNCMFSFTSRGSPYDIHLAYPQLVLRPRSRTGAHGYDMSLVDPINGTANVQIPGPSVNDPNGYLAEVYFRDDGGQPTRLVAKGQYAYTGGAYATEGPLGPATYPTGPAGPAGPAGQQGAPGKDSTVPGPPGQRGSQWFTGEGPPPGGSLDYLEGDMWLDVTTGDTWRFDSSMGMWTLT